MTIAFLGIDLAKNVFALHGVDATGRACLVRPSVRRDQLLESVAKLPPCTIGMEACSGAHHWARQFADFGHTVRLMAPKFVRKTDNAEGEGVWVCGEGEFEQRILDAAGQGRFSVANNAKAIAWRNVTVDAFNRRIRQRIFDNAASTMWLPDDRIILLEPAKDLNDETVATTDDEGRITRVEEEWHPTWREFKVWRVSVTTDDNRVIVLRVLHDDFRQLHDQKAEALAQAARMDRRKWRTFWDFKEAFHKVRHSYAITAHRAQGSTYEAAFVDWKDILSNRNRSEAFRCLYVACTRPKRELILG